MMALRMHDEAKILRDSFQVDEINRAIIKAGYDIEFQQRQKSDSIAYERRQQELAHKHEKQILSRNWLLLSSLLLGTIALLAFRFIQIRNRRQASLELAIEQNESRRLKELDQAKTRLYTNITHEFRTPLTVILGMNEESKEYFLERDKIGFNNATEMIRRNGSSLLHLVNQMLELSKLESGNFKVNSILGDIVPYISYIVESFASFADSQEVRLSYYKETDEVFMDYDPKLIMSICSNLISNALKFSSPQGHVSVFVTSESDRFIFKVQDNGPGMDAKTINQIFNRFYQSEMPQSAQGSGIGLSLVKELTELLGGKISVESRPGVGSEFQVNIPITQLSENSTLTSINETLPLSEIPNTNEFLANSARYNGDNSLVLIVEDNPDVRKYLLSILVDYECITANDGVEGIMIAKREVPDIIVTDVMMPGKDGLDLCNELKSDHRTDHIPIIMLTAKVTVEDRIEGLKKGADSYIPKPFNKGVLLTQMSNLISGRKKLQDRYSKAFGLSDNSLIHLQVEDSLTKRMKEVVLNRIDDPGLDVTYLCKELAVSRTQLHRKIKSVTGLSTTRFIRKLRLEKAQMLLKSTSAGIAQIAYDCGFSDPSYFSRVFIQEVGSSPTDFREA